MNIQQHLLNATKFLPQLEAEILLAFVLKKNRSYLHAFAEQTVTEKQGSQFLNLVERRTQGGPIAYLVGEKEFWSLSLKVTSDVLIPRPETELLVELILKQFPNQENFYVADLGTGSGAIALALASERPAWQIVATDKSVVALELAKQNAQQLKINNVRFLQSDWCDNLLQQFNIIVSNPPYIAPNDEHLNQGDLRFEPKTALVADQNGLSDFEIITTQSKEKILPNGYLFFEHGFEQGEAVRDILLKNSFVDVKTFRDLSGHERVTIGMKK